MSDDTKPEAWRLPALEAAHGVQSAESAPVASREWCKRWANRFAAYALDQHPLILEDMVADLDKLRRERATGVGGRDCRHGEPEEIYCAMCDEAVVAEVTERLRMGKATEVDLSKCERPDANDSACHCCQRRWRAELRTSKAPLDPEILISAVADVLDNLETHDDHPHHSLVPDFIVRRLRSAMGVRRSGPQAEADLLDQIAVNAPERRRAATPTSELDKAEPCPEGAPPVAIVQVRGSFGDGRDHLCWQGPNPDHDKLRIPFVCDECETVFPTREVLDEHTFKKEAAPFASPKVAPNAGHTPEKP